MSSLSLSSNETRLSPLDAFLFSTCEEYEGADEALFPCDQLLVNLFAVVDRSLAPLFHLSTLGTKISKRIVVQIMKIIPHQTKK